MSAEGRVENQNEPKRPPPCGRLGSFWFSIRLTRKKSDPPCADNRVGGKKKLQITHNFFFFFLLGQKNYKSQSKLIYTLFGVGILEAPHLAATSGKKSTL